MKPTYKQISLAAFLVLGTILSLIISIHCVSDFVHWQTLINRSPILISILLFDAILVLPIAGILSTYSFFTKGNLWKPITKGIIINIYLCLALVLVAILMGFSLYTIDYLIIAFVLVLCLLLLCLWKTVNSINGKSM